jgi:hypothetical protein
MITKHYIVHRINPYAHKVRGSKKGDQNFLCNLDKASMFFYVRTLSVGETAIKIPDIKS